jgi:hypothetical protein
VGYRQALMERRINGQERRCSSGESMKVICTSNVVIGCEETHKDLVRYQVEVHALHSKTNLKEVLTNRSICGGESSTGRKEQSHSFFKAVMD